MGAQRGLPASLTMTLGVARSLALYHLRPGHRGRLDRHYSRFLGPGRLAFDIGAHVGDRTASFRRLSARTVAVEPQPALAFLLHCLYGRDEEVTIETCAISDSAGEMELQINSRNPTVSTLSCDFVTAAGQAEHWRGQSWDRRQRVRVETLDALIERHGQPDFMKIDIEGAEEVALRGLTRPISTLSFEFTTIQREVAINCMARLMRLGDYRFNATLGEAFRFEHSEARTAQSLAEWLLALPVEANSGDLYASLDPICLRAETTSQSLPRQAVALGL